MANRALIATCLALISSATACRHASVEPSRQVGAYYRKLLIRENQDLRPPSQVTGQALQEDVRVLARHLRGGYGGKGLHPDDRVERVLARLEEWAPQSQAYSDQEACRIVRDLLEPLADSQIRVGYYQQSACHERPKGNVGPNSGSQVGMHWGLVHKNVQKTEIPVLFLKSFPSSDSQSWMGFKETVDKILELKPAKLVLDLRGSSGEEETYAEWLAQQLTGSPIAKDLVYIDRLESPEGYAFLANTHELARRQRTPQNQEVEAHLRDEMIEKAKTAFDNYPQGRRMIDNIEGRVRAVEPRFKGELYVLIDRGCARVCEDLVLSLRKRPGVTLIGERTQGAFHTQKPGSAFLPASRLIVRLPTEFKKYRSGQILEKYGIEPDLNVASGVDALTQIPK